MLLTHRLLLFLFISTLAAIALNITPITATSDSPVLLTNSTTTLPQISTLGINTKTTISTDSPNTSSSTTTTTTRTTHNVTPIDVTTANTTTTAASSTSTLVSTPGNTTNHSTISTGVNTSPVTTAAIHTSPHNSSTQPATNPTVTTSSNASTTSLPASANSTIPSPNPGGSVTPSPFSTTGNATYLPITSTVTTAPLSTQVNDMITTLTTSGHTPPKTNTTTPPITSVGNSTSPPLTTHVSPLTTHGNFTVSPVTTPGNTMSTVPTPVNATTPPQPTQASCPAVPCPALSVCVNLTCQCLAGTLLENGVCVEKKFFSSVLHLKRDFKDAMNNPQSPEFKEIANEIIEAVNNAMRSQPNYIRTEVLKLWAGSIVASVNSFFEINSPVNQTIFDKTMNETIQGCNVTTCGILANATYTSTSKCEQQPPPCDVETTECVVKNDLVHCNCRPVYVPNPYQTKSCTVCPSGQKAENGTCVPCSFGYSGFNCNDSSLLALVVVACVLGGILLIAILAILIYICGTCGREKPQENYYSSPYPTDDIQATWQSQGITPIPRANLTSTSSGNSLEMTEGAGRKFHNNGFTGSYDLNTEDMKTFTGKNSSRYSYLVGHENPYYLEGGDRSTT